MKILIVGMGAMGTWLAQQLHPKHDLCLWDHNPARLSTSCWGRPLRSSEEIRLAAPDMVINSVNLAQTGSVMSGLIPLLPKTTIFSDMASLKGDLQNAYSQWQRPFLSFHPLFGPLFKPIPMQERKTIVLISESDNEAKTWFCHQFHEPEYQIRELTFEAHDHAMILTLGLPFLLSLLGLHIVTPQTAVGSGLAAFLGHSQKVLCESPDLVVAVMKKVLSSDLPDMIKQSLEHWKRQTAEESFSLDYFNKKRGEFIM